MVVNRLGYCHGSVLKIVIHLIEDISGHVVKNQRLTKFAEDHFFIEKKSQSQNHYQNYFDLKILKNYQEAINHTDSTSSELLNSLIKKFKEY